MKSTGIVRKIDDLGRLVIPIELRKTMEINIKDPVEIFVEDDKIILRRYEPACTFCGEASNTFEFKGRIVCEGCKEEIAKTKNKD